MKEERHNKLSAHDKADDRYPGVAIDSADHEKVSEKLVKARIRKLNNNPRSTN